MAAAEETTSGQERTEKLSDQGPTKSSSVGWPWTDIKINPSGHRAQEETSPQAAVLLSPCPGCWKVKAATSRVRRDVEVGAQPQP